MCCMGLVHNYSGMMACRFFLGLAEAGLFPGVSKSSPAKHQAHANFWGKGELLSQLLVQAV